MAISTEDPVRLVVDAPMTTGVLLPRWTVPPALIDITSAITAARATGGSPTRRFMNA
jgi:hypothetical protein